MAHVFYFHDVYNCFIFIVADWSRRHRENKKSDPRLFTYGNFKDGVLKIPDLSRKWLVKW